VIYFGFTTCWRACPTALNAIAQAVEELGDAGNRVQPIFVSLDPQREEPETIELYLKGFGDRFVGLRGSEDQLQAAASAFGISVQRIRFSADPTDYTMVHSSPVIVLIPHKPDPILVKSDSSAEEIRAVLVSALELRAVSTDQGSARQFSNKNRAVFGVESEQPIVRLTMTPNGRRQEVLL